jgi:hypothetical protein
MVGLSDQSWLHLCISHGWLLGFLLKSFFVKVKVLEGGFGLWLGDNIVILPMVKREHPLLSNRLWAHTIFGQSNRWKIDWEDLLSCSWSCNLFFLHQGNLNPLIKAP